jgi:hypothetical protein
LIAVKKRKVPGTISVIRAMTEHLHHNVRNAKNFGAVGNNLCALRGKVRVGIAGLRSRPSLHDSLKTHLC